MSQPSQQIKVFVQCNRSQFPPINQKTEVVPFKMASDNELLMENDIQQKDKDKKIWQKTTASCRTALKRFDKFQTAVDDKYVPMTTFNHKQKKLIQNALEIIQMRKKNKDLAGKNQTIVDILQQKKEMFLVTMTHQIIQKQINNLKSQANQREKGLKQSNQILEQDIQDFQQYQEKYKNQTKKIQDQFQKQVQKRLAKQQQIKTKQISANSLRAQKARNQQNISLYLKYKRFLDRLPPKEWIQEKEKKKNRKLIQVKQKMKHQFIAKSSNKKSAQEQFQKYFNSIIETGQNQQIQQIQNNEQMYFQQPQQLIQYFNTLEQSNLFCIQNAQYAEQKYQQLKIKSQEKKNQLMEKLQNYQLQKKQLQKQFLQLESQVKSLRRKKQQNNVIDQKNSKEIKTMIQIQYQNMKDTMHSYLPEIQNNSQSLTLLSGIQICMERLWEKLCECYAENPKAIKIIKTQLQKKKTIEKRQEAAKANKLEQQKRKIRNSQKKAPILKVNGRIDMKRSPPQDKIVLKKVQTKDKDMDDDRKYLID